MKKIAFLMMTIVAAFTLSACNETEQETAQNHTFASVMSTSPVVLYADKGDVLTVAKDRTGSFKPSFGQRTLVYYNVLQNADGSVSATNKPIDVFAYYLFDVADTAVLYNDETNNYGDVDIDIYSYGGQYFLVHTTKQVVDIAVVLPYKEDMSQHRFTLVLDDTAPYEADNNLHVKLCHNASEQEITGAASTVWFLSFSMEEFADYIEGTNGITIETEGMSTSSTKTHTFKWID